jgi:hypothetical protein
VETLTPAAARVFDKPGRRHGYSPQQGLAALAPDGGKEGAGATAISVLAEVSVTSAVTRWNPLGLASSWIRRCSHIGLARAVAQRPQDDPGLEPDLGTEDHRE